MGPSLLRRRKLPFVAKYVTDCFNSAPDNLHTAGRQN